MLRRIIVVLVASLAMAGGLAAQGNGPTQPPTEEGQEASPPGEKPEASADEIALRGVLKSLATALQEGDGDGIRGAIYAANPTERKMVDAMASMAVEIAQLYKASVTSFGEEQARSLTGDMAAELSRIDDAQVSIDGETATVRYARPTAQSEGEAGDEGTKSAVDSGAGAPSGAGATGAPSGAGATDANAGPDGAPAVDDAGEVDAAADEPAAPMILRKIDGQWRVPASELAKGATPEEIDQRLADLTKQAKVIAELREEIEKGQHPTADKAAEAWQAKMMQAIMPRPASGKAAEGESEKTHGAKPQPVDEEEGHAPEQ